MVKVLIYFFIFLSLVYLIFTLYRILFVFHLLDFSYYYTSIQFIINHKSPYINKVFTLNYPPSFLLLFFPLGVINYKISQLLWTFLSLGGLLGSIYLILKYIDSKVSISKFLIILSFIILSFPVKFTFGMGQINFILLFLFALCFYLYQKKRIYLSGIVLGIATSIKIFPFFLIFFFLRKKDFYIPIISITFFISLNLLAAILFGKNIFFEYFTQTIFNIPIYQASYYNQSLTGFLARLGTFNTQLIFIINYTVFIILIFISFLLTKPKEQSPFLEITEFSLFIITILIGGGLAWQHYFVLLIIPFAGFINYFFDNSIKRMRLLIFFVALSYLAISSNIKHPESFIGPHSLLLSHVFYGTVLLYFILVKTSRKIT